MKLHKYQSKVKDKLLKVLIELNVAYLAGEVRTGKTITVLNTINEYFPFPKSVRVLFITSKKAKDDIIKQYKTSGLKFRKIFFTNFESLHKFTEKIDFMVVDEAHRLGTFPKPNKAARYLRKHYQGVPSILMSGTPSPESHSQLYHQFWATGMGPWKDFTAFYNVPTKHSWSRNYVNIKKVNVSFGLMVNSYKDTYPEVMSEFRPYCVTMTQEQAGFKGQVVEHFHYVPTPLKLQLILSLLKQTGVVKKPQLVADSASKMSSYFHQLSSGTVIDIEGKPFLLDKFKIAYLKKTFPSERLAIFYIYRAEGELLRKAYPNWTSDPSEFESGQKTFLSQVSSGREGVNLSSASSLVFFNIAYSATSYWQARSRHLTRESGDVDVHWLFSSRGVEQAVYEAVVKKQNFTLNHFKDYVRRIQTKAYSNLATQERVDGHKVEGNRSIRTARPYGTKKRRSVVYRSKATTSRAK